jgi:hypothetical protein
MAIVDKAGSVNNLSSVDTPNALIAQNVTAGGKTRIIRDTVEIDAADDDTSKYRLARLPANAILESITIDHDAITGGTDFDLGFYDVPETNSGAVISGAVDVLVDGATLAVAGSVDGLGNVAIENRHKKIWEIAGLAADPNKLVDIVLTGNVVGTASGTVTLSVNYALD